MAQFDIAFDYLELLGIEPADVPTLGVDYMANGIKTKKKEWTGQAINPLYQQEAKSKLERVRQFDELLKAPEALTAYVTHLSEVRAARREQQEDELRQLIAAATLGKKELTPR